MDLPRAQKGRDRCEALFDSGAGETAIWSCRGDREIGAFRRDLWLGPGAFSAVAVRAVQTWKKLPRLQSLAGLAVLATLAISAPAPAYQVGVTFLECAGCHGELNEAVDLSVEFDPLPSPGEQITVTIRIAYDQMQGAGFFATADGVGTLEPMDDQSKVSLEGVTHTAPISASSGQAEVKLLWTLPDTPSGGALSIGAVAANLNRNRTGDATALTTLPVAWGCDLVVLYADLDRDGFATEDFGITGGCEESPGWAVTLGDCNQNNAAIFPGAEEICDEKDNDCDGEVDEDTMPIPLYVDADGDGVGVLPEAKVGCVEDGYSPISGDCDDRDPSSYPGASEVCDQRDNDCDGRTDNGALATCGVGWCRREALSCSVETCTPGPPGVERCNGIDDDCDGIVDNDTTECGQGLVCYLGVCFTPEDAAAIAALSNGGAPAIPTSAIPTAVTPTTMPGETGGPAAPNTGGAINGAGGSAATPMTNPAAVGSVGGAGSSVPGNVPNASQTPGSGLTANGGEGVSSSHEPTTASACSVQPRSGSAVGCWLAFAAVFGLRRGFRFRFQTPRRRPLPRRA